MRRKNNYVMRRLDTPKKVTLLNGRTFYAKYQRAPRSQLPPNVIMKRKYRRRAAPKGRRRRLVRKGERRQSYLSSFLKKPKIQGKTNRKSCSKKSCKLCTRTI